MAFLKAPIHTLKWVQRAGVKPAPTDFLSTNEFLSTRRHKQADIYVNPDIPWNGYLAYSYAYFSSAVLVLDPSWHRWHRQGNSRVRERVRVRL